MAELCGVIGIGQTHHTAARKEMSMPGLLREAAQRALDDAELTWKDIDAVVIGKAPDMFEGVMMPELFLNDALGGAYKPMLRVHTAGSVGVHEVIPPLGGTVSVATGERRAPGAGRRTTATAGNTSGDARCMPARAVRGACGRWSASA